MISPLFLFFCGFLHFFYVHAFCLFFYWVLFKITYLEEVFFLMLSKLALCPLVNVGIPNPSSLIVNYRPSYWVVQSTYFLDEETEETIGFVTFLCV